MKIDIMVDKISGKFLSFTAASLEGGQGGQLTTLEFWT